MSPKHIALFSFIAEANEVLQTSGAFWAEDFVAYRMRLHREFSSPNIFTTEHGAEIFSELELDVKNPNRYLQRVKAEKRMPDEGYVDFIKSLQ